MIRNHRQEVLAAYLLILPFVLSYGLLLFWPTLQMVYLSFTDAPLIGPGTWVGVENYVEMFDDRRFWTSVRNTSYFVALTVIPNTLIGLAIALMVSRLKGWQQSVILAMFFLPYILPVSVVYRIWNWMFNVQFGIMQYPLTCGFNVLLFLAGLRSIPGDIYEAASLDNASRWTVFRRITWPLIWPVTALVLTIQLILQLKIFDQVYLFVQGGRPDPSMVMIQYIYTMAFQRNEGGYAAALTLALFVIVIVFSVLQFQLLRARGEK